MPILATVRRALSGDFPFYGKLETEPPEAAAAFRAGAGALLEEALLIQYGANVLRLKAAFLQGRADEESVIHAAVQPIRRIRILIDSNDQRTACRRRHKITCNSKATRHNANRTSQAMPYDISSRSVVEIAVVMAIYRWIVGG